MVGILTGSGSAAGNGSGQEARDQRSGDLQLRKHFVGMKPADVKRLRQLEQENNRLKKLAIQRHR